MVSWRTYATRPGVLYGGEEVYLPEWPAYEGTTEESWRGWVDNGKVHGEAAGLSFTLSFEEHSK